MCGIFGATALTENTRPLLPILAAEMESRGRDSWGSSNGSEIFRHLGPITNTWAHDREAVGVWDAGIWHTRQASTGAVTVENCHPFRVERSGREIIGIHNGVISNWLELNKTYSRNAVVDSQHIWMHKIEDKKFGDFRGWGNLAWWERSNPSERPKLHFGWFDTKNFYLLRLNTGEFVFASTSEGLVRAANLFGHYDATLIPIEGNIEYTVETGWDEPVKVGELGYARVGYVYNDTRGGRGRRTGRGAYDGDNWADEVDWGSYGTRPVERRGKAVEEDPTLCAQCSDTVDKNLFVCAACLQKLYNYYTRDQAEAAAIGVGMVAPPMDEDMEADIALVLGVGSETD